MLIKIYNHVWEIFILFKIFQMIFFSYYGNLYKLILFSQMHLHLFVGQSEALIILFREALIILFREALKMVL